MHLLKTTRIGDKLIDFVAQLPAVWVLWGSQQVSSGYVANTEKQPFRTGHSFWERLNVKLKGFAAVLNVWDPSIHDFHQHTPTFWGRWGYQISRNTMKYPNAAGWLRLLHSKMHKVIDPIVVRPNLLLPCLQKKTVPRRAPDSGGCIAGQWWKRGPSHGCRHGFSHRLDVEGMQFQRILIGAVEICWDPRAIWRCRICWVDWKMCCLNDSQVHSFVVVLKSKQAFKLLLLRMKFECIVLQSWSLQSLSGYACFGCFTLTAKCYVQLVKTAMRRGLYCCSDVSGIQTSSIFGFTLSQVPRGGFLCSPG